MRFLRMQQEIHLLAIESVLLRRQPGALNTKTNDGPHNFFPSTTFLDSITKNSKTPATLT
jgi:hypothetical protein